MEDKPLGMGSQNSFGAVRETDSEQEIPLESFDDFPSISREVGRTTQKSLVNAPRLPPASGNRMLQNLESFESMPPKSQIECLRTTENKMVTRHGIFNTKTLKQKKEERRTSRIASWKLATGGQEPHPLIRVKDTDDQPGLYAVSDSSRWSVCPMTGFMTVISVLDSGATDSCAPDCMCPEVKRGPSERSRRGQTYTAASGKKIANQGEKDIAMVTGAKEVVQASWQTVDITRPLSSVRQICLQGNRVLFCAQETPFGIEDTVYVLDLWQTV